MKRRDFLKIIAVVPLLPAIAKSQPQKTNGKIQIFSGNDLIVGRMYLLTDKKTGEWAGYETCKRDGGIYFRHRIWAELDNPQAFQRWDIFETRLTDSSYDEEKENRELREQWARDFIPFDEFLKQQVRKGYPA